MTYKSIRVVKGSGGYGGPLVITPTEERHKFIYITGGGERPAIVDKPMNGANKTMANFPFE